MIPKAVLGRYTDNSSARINSYRHLSRSAQNLNTDQIADSNGDSTFQSLPFKRNYIKNTVKSKNIALHTNKNHSEVVIAIDIGTTFSGFSFAIEDTPCSSVNIMKSIKGNGFSIQTNFIRLDTDQALVFRSEYEKITFDFITKFTNGVSLFWIRCKRLFSQYRAKSVFFINSVAVV